MCSLHVLSVPVWVLSEYSGFFPKQSKDMHGVTSNGDHVAPLHDPDLDK